MERRLIFHCLKDESFKEETKEIRWPLLENILESERLFPLFYDWAQRSPKIKERVPPALFSKIKQKYYETAARNALQVEETKKVLKQFQRLQIPVILHKGIFLGPILYQNIALRPMFDVDLLVPMEKIPDAEGCLKSMGFKQGDAKECWGNAFLSIDLHADIINTKRFRMLQKNPSARMQEIWKNAKPILLDGIPALTLSPEDQLIALCFHLAFNHRMEGLLWFSDLHRFLVRYKKEIDWEKVAKLSGEYENEKSVFYCLKYLSEKWRSPVPQKILDLFEPEKTGWMEKRLAKRIWKEKPPGNLGYFFSLAMIENGKMRRRYLWLTFFTLRWPQFLSAGK